MTKNRQRVVTFLQENEKDFRQGNEFTDKAINKYFGIVVPEVANMQGAEAIKAAARYQSKKVSVQTAINKVLAQFGLYMSQKQFSNYRVRDLNETNAKIKALRASGNRKIRFAAKLQTGLACCNGVLRLGK